MAGRIEGRVPMFLQLCVEAFKFKYFGRFEWDT